MSSTFYADGFQDGKAGLKASPPAPYSFHGNTTSVYAAEYLAGWGAGRASVKTPLLTVWPLANCNLNDDGFGNLVPVPGIAWSAAHYFANSI